MKNGRDFITLLDLSGAEIVSLLNLAERLRQDFKSDSLPTALDGKSVALIWDAGGFRNQVAFELGIAALGGRSVQVPGRLDERESIEDVVGYLDNWFDAIIARTATHAHMLRLAGASKKPVINARTPYNHPCEILGDLAFVQAWRRSIEGLNVVFVGEGTNLCHSWFEAAAQLPIRVVQVCPQGYEVNEGFLAKIRSKACGETEVTNDLEDALRGADVVYTDCWPKSSAAEERAEIENEFAPYRITASVLESAPPDALFLPCPPVHRGEEVSDDAVSSPQCSVYEAKDYLLHAQNALLIMILSPESITDEQKTT